LVTWAERAHEGNLDLSRTPVADENGGGPVSPAMAKAKGQTLRLTGQIIDLVEPGRLAQPLLATPTTQPSSGKCRDHGGDLLHDVTCGCPRVERRLPTPTVADHASTRNSTANRKYPEKAHGGDTLTDVFVPKLLPTVMANEAEKATNRQNAEQRAQTGQVMVTNVAQTLEQSGTWGQYEPAIRRWESIIGREAPAPTIPDGRDGQQRLSPLLTEWMMGLDEGHITSPEIGISRNDQIKAAGNGVVPQQASLALRYLLKGKTWLL